jgi:hypothetical protein
VKIPVFGHLRPTVPSATIAGGTSSPCRLFVPPFLYPSSPDLSHVTADVTHRFHIDRAQ